MNYCHVNPIHSAGYDHPDVIPCYPTLNNLITPTALLRLLVLLLLCIAFGTTQAQQRPEKRNLILIRGYQFNPLMDTLRLSFTTPTKVLPDSVNYRLIQFSRPLNRQETKIVKEEIGLSLDLYIPNNAFLEKLTSSQLERIRAQEFFRWDGFYEPAYKLDPNIGNHTFITKERQSEPGILLMVVAFPNVSIHALAARIRGLGFEIVSRTDEAKLGIQRLQARLNQPIDARAIAMLPEVYYIEEVGEVTHNNGTTSWVIQTNVNNSRTIWDHGLQGQDQIIGHIDGIIDLNNCFFMDNVDNTVRPAHRKVVGFRNSSGSTNSRDHGTFTAGNAAGEDFNNDAVSAVPNANNGNAPRARLTHGNLNDLDLNAGGGTSFFSYLTEAKEDGAFIHTNSWDPKNTNNYTQVSVDADRFTWENEDHLIIFGPDNSGPIRPGTNAKNVLVVNATQQNPNQNNFSSGVTSFTQDGRRKPDIMAPGAGLVSADDLTACGTRVSSGTSFAAPSVAGTAALVRQYFTEGWYPSGTRQLHHAFLPTGNLMKAMLANATVDATGIAGYPGVAGMGEGFGRLLLENGLFFDGDNRNLIVWDTRNSNGLFAGESHTYTVEVENNNEPLRITLVWNEPPGVANTTGGAAEAVGSLTINDLDLVVTAPDGTTLFSGNDFNTATGQTIANGGTEDGLNVLEQVILTTPALGVFTITIQEGANGIAQGPQGYAVVATGNFPDPPIPTGPQNTLVVRAGISNLLSGSLPGLSSVQNVMTQVANYVNEVSYGVTTINPVYATVSLPQTSTFYFHPSRSPLVEMAEDAIAGLLAADPNTFTLGTADPTDDIDRLILVINDPSFTGDWATTGPWPYSLPGGITRPISVSVQSIFNDPQPRFTHGLAHQLGLVDLYAHPGVVFAQPYVENWDHMAVSFINTGLMAWSKEHAEWITTHGSSITYIPRPAGTVSQTIGINFMSNTSPNVKAIAIGLTEGAATLEDEEVFYFIEARDNSGTTADAALPESGVLLYYINENIPQGQGPVRIIDDVVGTTTLDDASFEIGDSKTTAEGLTITVLAGTGGADRNIQINYTPPVTDNDVNIEVGDPVWTSPDIWVDSPRNGFDADNGLTPADRGDDPVLNVVNRLYYRIHNPGPDDARDFMIYATISEPYHTVGGQADFNLDAGQRFVTTLAATGDLVDYFEWTPVADDDPHSCALVSIPNVFNDVNTLNNEAQQNLEVVSSVTASPYESVTYRFGFTNPEDHQELFYFRPTGIPADWTYAVTPVSARLSAGERIEASLTVQPPDDAPVCTNHQIHVTCWSPRGNTLIAVGGGTVQVNLRNRTDLTLNTQVKDCRRDPDQHLPPQETPSINSNVNPKIIAQGKEQSCQVIESQGCTNPVRPNEEITLRYETPDGYPIYRTVVTDAFGCFSDAYVVAEGGLWTVTTEYPGTDCSGPASDAVKVSVSLPTTGDQDDDHVPDRDEPQGDHDRDGIIGIFDTDSDNDQVPDGEEIPGDPDRDGHDNRVDPDSDNDGIIDGKDPRPYGDEGLVRYRKLQIGCNVGSSHPVRNFNANSDANIHVGVDLVYTIMPSWKIVLMGGLHQFTKEISDGTPHDRWINASLDVHWLIPNTWGLLHYVQAGIGNYWPKSGSSQTGFNLGIGSGIPLGNQRQVKFGLDYHHLLGDQKVSFANVKLGLVF